MDNEQKLADLEAKLKDYEDRLAKYQDRLDEISKGCQGLFSSTELLTVRLDALEGAVLTGQTSPAETVTQKTAIKPKLTGDTFKVGSKTYRLKYPHFEHGGKSLTEADVLDSKVLQKELVDGGYGVIVQVTAD